MHTNPSPFCDRHAHLDEHEPCPFCDAPVDPQAVNAAFVLLSSCLQSSLDCWFFNPRNRGARPLVPGDRHPTLYDP